MKCVKPRLIHRPVHLHYLALLYTTLSYPTYPTLPGSAHPYLTLTTLPYLILLYTTQLYQTIPKHSQSYQTLPYSTLYPTLPYNPTQTYPTTLPSSILQPYPTLPYNPTQTYLTFPHIALHCQQQHSTVHTTPCHAPPRHTPPCHATIHSPMMD